MLSTGSSGTCGSDHVSSVEHGVEGQILRSSPALKLNPLPLAFGPPLGKNVFSLVLLTHTDLFPE